MHGITRFNANGQTFDIPETAAPDFLKDAPDAQRTRRFTAGGNTYDIPDGEADAFLKDAPDAVETRTIGYRGADGTDKTVDVPLADMPKFLRRYNADETYAADREQTRTGIEAKLPKTDESPMWAGVRAFGEGLVRSVTDAANLWRETYGDSPVADALLGANANANKIVNGILGIPEDIESIASMAAGGENTAAGKWLKEDARAGRAYLESLHPTRISDAVGREDWGTIAGDKIGDISATIIKFAAGDKDPTKLFNPLVVSSAAADSYAQTYDNAIAHGKSVEDANYLANGSAVWNALMTMFMMRAFKGETAAVQRDVGKSAKDVLRREAMQTAKTGNVMGVQAAGNKAIEANAEGRNVTAKELATAYAEGLGEGALFHSVNALGAQISEYGHIAERRAEWVEEFRDHILNNQSDREMYLKTPMGDPMRAICESVQNGTLPDRRAFVSAGIPKELCKTEAQRREIAQNFIDTIGITADAKNARAAQNIIDVANMMGEGDPIALNVYREWRDVIEENSVPKDVRLWNGRKVVAERVDMGDGKSGYDIYHDAGDGKLQLITTSDEPLLLDAYADAKADMMNYFGLETPKSTGVTIETKKLREQIEDAVKTEEPAKEVKNEAPSRDNPQAVDEPVSGEPAPAEAGRRDEGMAPGDGADAASPRGTAAAVVAPETSAPSAEATLERGAQDALAAALEAVKPTAKKRPGKVEAKTETPNDWRTMKVDEVDADGKPLTDDDKMVLRQSKVLSGMHDTWHDTSRKNFDAYVKLFDEVEAARDFGKTSAGDSGLMDARKVARDLALSKFATPEEVARFKKYYEGEPTADEPVVQEPSKTPAEPSASEPVKATDPTAPSAQAKPQGLNLNAESIRRANDVSMMGTAGDTLAKDAQAMYESGLNKLADTDGMTPDEKAQAATEREQWKALVESAYNDMIAKRANWVSPAVAGPAKYNHRKWGKRQDAMITAGNEWQGKMERFIENAGKRIREAAPEQVQIDRIRANGTDEAINSGDANAAAKIQAKIDNLRAEQERMKAMNAWFRKHKTMVGFEGLSDEAAKKMDAQIANAYSWEKAPAPDYALKNNGANIRRLEKRLDEVKANAAKAAEATPTESAWGTVTENAEANRLQVAFSGGKPSAEVTALMRHNGFKWSPKSGVWQRQLTDNARRTMERIKPDLDKLFGVDADKAAKAEAFNAPAFEVGANGEKVAIGPKAEKTPEQIEAFRKKVESHLRDFLHFSEKDIPKKVYEVVEKFKAGGERKRLTYTSILDGEESTPVVEAAFDVRDKQSNLYKVEFSPASKKAKESARERFKESVDAFKKAISDPSVSLEELKREAAVFDAKEKEFDPDDRHYSQHHDWEIGNSIRAEIARREGTEVPLERDEFHPQGRKPEDPWMASVREDKNAILLNKRYGKAKTDGERKAIKNEFDKLVEKHKAEWEKQNVKAEPAAEPAPVAPKRRPGKKAETEAAPVDAQYDRAVKAVESAEKESANARSFDELSNIQDRARSALGKITMEQENELMARLDKAFYDNQGRVGNVRSQGGYTPSKEIIEAKSRIEAMPTSTSREKAAKKKAQKDWLLSSVDDAIKSHGDTRTINDKPFAESFADEFESLLRRRDATYDAKKLGKIQEQIAAAKKTMAKGEMLTFDVPDDGTFKIRNNPEALALFKRMVQKRLSPTNLKEGTLAKAEKPLAEDVKEANIGEKQAEQPKESRRGPTVDAAKLDDPAFREWSATRGTKSDDAEALRRDRVAYDLDQATDAAKRTGNWIGVKVVRETNADAMPTANAKPIKDGGQVIGWYDPATKEVHLKPGADAKTVAHEVGWHATYDWAKANHPALAKTMEQYAANAPEALKAEIRKLYGRDLTPAELIEEIGAGRFEREHGRKLQKLLADRANRTWYAKVWDGIKDAYNAVLTKLGFNRVDLDEALKDKTPEQAMDFLASAMARGQALGKMRPGKARDGARPMAAITPVPSPGGTGLFVDPQTRLNRRERWMRQMKYHNIALRTLDERLGRWVDGRPTDDSLFMHRINQEGLKKAAMDRSDFYENAIGKLMKAHGFGVDEVDAYLHYLGSPERNALVMRRDGRQDGSGESDQHWADAWHAVETTYGPEAQYIKQAAHIAWAMQEEGLVSRLNSGRISRDHYDTLKQNEPHHIPHKKDLSELDPELYSTSGGKGIRRNEFMSAHGTDGSDSPLVFMFREFRDAELGSRENEWRIRLADAVRQNPDLGRIRSAQRMENGLVQLNGDIGMGLKLEQKKEMHHPADGGDPNLVLFKEGGELKAIELNGDFGSDIADAVTGRSIVDFKPDGLQGKVKKISRAYANTATSWSPTFGFGNFAKDKVEVGLHNVGDFGYGRLATIPRGFAEAAGDMTGTSSMMRELKRYIGDRSFDTTTADGRLLKEFVESGGPIGGAASEGFQDTLKRFDRFNLASKQGKLKMMWETFQNFNERMEMINRLRNFKTARDHGMSPSQAAFKSRQDSTDFNAFGRQKWMNTVWNFSNSVTGGTLASMVRVAKGASSKRVIGTLAALGVLEALTEYMLNGNEEKEELEGKSIGKDMSEYERANAITIRKGEHFFRLPIHAGPYSIIKYAFNGATRVALGMMDAKEYAKNLASEVRDTAKHFTGTGDVAGGDEEDLPVLNALGAPDMGQSFAPSMLQPAVQIKEKKTFSGAPMESYQQPNDPEPKSWNGRKDTEIGYKWMAQAQNAIGGGDRHLKGGAGGSADTSPEVFKAAFEGVFKNTGKDAMQTFDVLKNLATGHLPELRNVPVVNRFVRKVQPNDRRYYETLKRYKAIVNKATKEEDDDKATRWVRQHPSGDSSVDKHGARMANELDNLIKMVEFYKKQSQGYEPVLTGNTSPSGVPQVSRWEPVELTREAKEAIDADLRRAQADFIVTFRKYEADGK